MSDTAIIKDHVTPQTLWTITVGFWMLIFTRLLSRYVMLCV